MANKCEDEQSNKTTYNCMNSTRASLYAHFPPKVADVPPETSVPTDIQLDEGAGKSVMWLVSLIVDAAPP